MAGQIQRNGGGGGRGYNPPTKGKGTKTGVSSALKSINPALITSTGGLLATSGLLLTPFVSMPSGNGYIVLHDPFNFDCEEDAEYDFRQENPRDQEGRDVTCHLIILKYRELGVAKFNINVTVYLDVTDTFKTVVMPVSISPLSSRKSFPDNRIHTKDINISPVITGERPQVFITRKANSGPLSITKLILCGNADETEDM